MKLTGLVAFALISCFGSAQGWVERTQLTRPSARVGHGMCWDPVRGYVLVAGGMAALSFSPANTPPANETWSWDGVTWTSRGPTPFVSATLVVHEQANRVLALGNAQGSGAIGCYEWNGAAWQSMTFPGPYQVTPLVALGTMFYGHYGAPPAAYDPLRQEIIAFVSPTDVAVFDGTSWSARPASAPVNNIASAAFDPAAGRIVVTESSMQWALIGASWVQFATTRWHEWNGVGLSLRYVNDSPSIPGCSATDTVRQRVMHFDADSPSSQVPAAGTSDHTWLFANSVSTRLSTPVTPIPRLGAAMTFDPVRRRMVMFGGSTHSFPGGAGQVLSDTWEFDLGPLATFTGYGTGCPASRGVPRLAAQPNSAPRVRNPFGVIIDNLPWSAPTFLLFGLSNTTSSGLPLPFDLGIAGAPGCTLLTSIDNILPLNNVLGSAAWTIDLPYLPGASFYLQAVPFEPTANALGVALSNGGHGLLGL